MDIVYVGVFELGWKWLELGFREFVLGFWFEVYMVLVVVSIISD